MRNIVTVGCSFVGLTFVPVDQDNFIFFSSGCKQRRQENESPELKALRKQSLMMILTRQLGTPLIFIAEDDTPSPMRNMSTIMFIMRMFFVETLTTKLNWRR